MAKTIHKPEPQRLQPPDQSQKRRIPQREERIMTVRELKEVMDQRFDAQDKRIDQGFDTVNQRFDAIDKRFDAIDKRFDDLWKFAAIIVALTTLFVSTVVGLLVYFKG